MKLQFDANQDFQLAAIEAVVALFAGQPRVATDFTFGGGASFFAAVANRLDLTEDELLANLREVQARNGIAPYSELRWLQERIVTDHGPQDVRFPNFSVAMETGTGKTYVYLRTIYELRKQYGFRKFIIVVPSIAIYEGVIKSFEVMKRHFSSLYSN